MKLYHKDIGFPSSFILADKLYIGIKYSRHALKKRKEIDKHLPNKQIVKFPGKSVIEVGISKKGRVKILVIRKSFSKKKDIIFVLDMEIGGFVGKVITLWINDKKDKHFSLDKTKYTKPYES